MPIPHDCQREGFCSLCLSRSLKINGMKYSFRGLLYTIKSGRSAVGYYGHEMPWEKRLYVNRPIKVRVELARIFKNLEKWGAAVRCEAGATPIQRGISAELGMFRWVGG